MTQEILIKSEEFKDWIGDDKVALIHNTYYDSKIPYASFIVIHASEDQQENSKWTITRFFPFIGTERINVSVDYSDISTEECFKILLTEYSRGLD